MEELFIVIAELAELVLEFLLVVAVLIGAVMAVLRISMSLGRSDGLQKRREAWVGFAGWLLIALEFALAADLVGTAISPSWDDVGMLAAIAVIRTFLGFFLERDIESIRGEGGKGGEERAA